MKIKDSSCTIVILGNWNKYILSPAWVAKNIFDESKLKVEFAINLELPPRFTSNESNIILIPSDDKVTFVASDPKDEHLLTMEILAQKLVDILRYTPISAFGINFGFVEDISSIDIYSLFNLSDIGKLSDFGCELKGTSIKREIIIEEKILHLTIAQNEGEVSFDFNFHYNIEDSGEFNDKIKDNVIQNKGIAEKLLQNVYEVKEIEEYVA